jgi:DNA-binding transcriptional LysR family regulator
MTMNLSWLEDFLALASSGNFSRAAEERHMTQPAFSRRIRALEEWLGAELLDRSTQPARLTGAGEWLRDTAEQLLAQVARLPGEARAVAEANSSSLRFAATHALSFTFLTNWLRSLESRTSVGPITLVSDVLARCESMLLESQVQFVMAHAHSKTSSKFLEKDFSFVRVGSDVLVPVSASNPVGVARHRLEDAKDDSPVATLTYSDESGLGRILREVCGAKLQRFPTSSAFRAHLASALRTMALDGRGLAWLPRTLIADDLAAGRLVEAAGPEWHIDLEIRLYRGRAPLGKAGEEFWSAVCASVEA